MCLAAQLSSLWATYISGRYKRTVESRVRAVGTVRWWWLVLLLRAMPCPERPQG